MTVNNIVDNKCIFFVWIHFKNICCSIFWRSTLNSSDALSLSNTSKHLSIMLQTFSPVRCWPAGDFRHSKNTFRSFSIATSSFSEQTRGNLICITEFTILLRELPDLEVMNPCRRNFWIEESISPVVGLENSKDWRVFRNGSQKSTESRSGECCNL